MCGLIVKKDFNHHIMSGKDLPTYTQLTTSSVTQSILVPFAMGSFELVQHYLSQMFDPIEATADDAANCDLLMVECWVRGC